MRRDVNRRGITGTGWAVPLLAMVVSGCSTVVPAPVEEHSSAPPSVVNAPIQSGSKGEKPLVPLKPKKEIVAGSWGWPLAHQRGAYDAKTMGLDRVVTQSEPVMAVADGVVSYVGDGISTYGLMVIIKHPDDYVSVYAQNSRVLVRQGQVVTRGQRVAETGVTGKKGHPWHFELRHAGKPINPLPLFGRHGDTSASVKAR